MNNALPAAQLMAVHIYGPADGEKVAACATGVFHGARLALEYPDLATALVKELIADDPQVRPSAGDMQIVARVIEDWWSENGWPS